MRRMYTAAQFAAMVNKLKSRFPDFNITTDMIVGFPGETEEEFEQSVHMAQELAFSHIHTFKYSIRTGTRAERMPVQISEKVKNQRSAILRNISTANKKEYYSTMIGKPQRMLIERITSDGTARGYGENYIPLRLKGKNLQKNQFVNVLLTGLHEGKEPESSSHTCYSSEMIAV